MSSNPFKAFIPYTAHPIVVSAPDLRLPDDLAPYLSVDPSGGSWRTVGLTKTLEGDHVHELDGAGSLLVVQFNERILPGKVRDEKIQARKNKLEALEGRKLTKAEYAQLREEVEFDLLPKAFIRRSQVPVIFMHPNIMLVCTGSQKKADDTVALLSGLFEHLEPVKMATVRPLQQWLTTLAKESVLDNGIDFTPGMSAVLKGFAGEAKKTIRIKDRDIGGHEVQALLGSTDYVVTDLAIDVSESNSETPLLSMSLSDSMIFKRCALPGVKASETAADEHGFAYLCATTYRKVLNELLDQLGGLVTQKREQTSASSSEDEEEL